MKTFCVATQYIFLKVIKKKKTKLYSNTFPVPQNASYYKSLSLSPEYFLVHGLFLDAASYNTKTNRLADPSPGIINPPLPVMQLHPVSEIPENQARYACPLYKTSVRAGTLSTTGHSTNFVVTVMLPSRQPEAYWVLKGAALLTQITD